MPKGTGIKKLMKHNGSVRRPESQAHRQLILAVCLFCMSAAVPRPKNLTAFSLFRPAKTNHEGRHNSVDYQEQGAIPQLHFHDCATTISRFRSHNLTIGSQNTVCASALKLLWCRHQLYSLWSPPTSPSSDRSTGRCVCMCRAPQQNPAVGDGTRPRWSGGKDGTVYINVDGSKSKQFSTSFEPAVH